MTGKDISYHDSMAHTKSEKGKLRLIALIDIVMKFSSSRGGERRGIAGALITLFLAALEEVWDLLSHYAYPAVVIEQKPIKELVPQIKALKKNVPAALVGVFGIDLLGGVVNAVISPLFLIMLAISVVIGYAIALGTTATVITISGVSFSWVPVLIMLYLIGIFGAVIKVLVESAKVIYFTIFYTSIMRPREITPALRKELTHYLLLKKGE